MRSYFEPVLEHDLEQPEATIRASSQLREFPPCPQDRLAHNFTRDRAILRESETRLHERVHVRPDGGLKIPGTARIYSNSRAQRHPVLLRETPQAVRQHPARKVGRIGRKQRLRSFAGRIVTILSPGCKFFRTVDR